MRSCFRMMTGACLIALTLGLILAAQPASAQAPAPATGVAPAPAPANVVVARLTNPPAGAAAMVAPARFTTPNPARSQARVYTVPSQGSSSTRPRLHYGYWPARREVFVAKPWLKPD